MIFTEEYHEQVVYIFAIIVMAMLIELVAYTYIITDIIGILIIQVLLISSTDIICTALRIRITQFRL